MNVLGRQTGKGLGRFASRRAMLTTGAVILALAIVIALAAAFSPSRPGDSIPLPTVTSPSPSQQLYDQATKAQGSGDTTKALDLAKRSVAADPSNTKAKVLVSQLEAGGAGTVVVTRGGGGSGGSGNGNGSSDTTKSSPPKSKDDGFTTAISDLKPLLPKSFAAFSLDQVVATGGDVSVSAGPKQANNAASRIMWAVHDRKTTAGAAGFVNATSKQLYPKSAATVTVDGVQAYFGTDGSRFATVSYTRGRYVFEVLVSANGVAPATLRSLSVSAAQGFRDTRP